MRFLSCQDLLNRCVDIVDSYNNFNIQNSNAVEEMLASLNSLEKADQIFITEIFLGCSEFDKLLMIVLDDFYKHENDAFLSDKTLFKVIAYLVTFRIHDIKMDGILEFVLQMNQTERVLQFMKFYLDEQYLMARLSPIWCEICDDDFIEDVIEKVIRSLSDFNDMYRRVEQAMSTSKKKKHSSEKDLLQFGNEIPTLKSSMVLKAKMWDKFLAPDKKEMTKINAWKETFNLLVEKIKLPLNNLEDDSVNYDNKSINNNENGNNSQQLCDGKTKTKAAVIRMNTTAILREGLLYKKKDEEMIRKIGEWESGGGDETKYEEWQRKVKEEEDQRKYEELQVSKLMGMLTMEQSIIAKQKAIEDKKKTVEAMRAQAAKLMQEFLVIKLSEEEKMRLKRQKVSSMKRDSVEARKRMVEIKARAVQSMQEEMREMMRSALEEMTEQEMRQRLEVIRKIRDLEMNRTVRSKVIDLNGTSGCGLHSEMSLMELRERLKAMQEEEAIRIEAKKTEILQNKQMKEKMIQDTLSSIARHRDELAKAACIRQEKKRSLSSSSIQTSRHKSQTIMELERRYEDLKMQRMFDRSHIIAGGMAVRQKNESSVACTDPNGHLLPSKGSLVELLTV